MKIVTLGTSHGAAEIGRACTSTLIESGENVYLIDCGGSCEAAMTDLGYDFAKLRAVFVTHMHEDHAGALCAVTKRVAGYTKGLGRLKVYLPEEEAIAAFKAWRTALKGKEIDRITYHTVTVGEFYNDGVIAVWAIPTRHLGDGYPSYAYKVVCEGKTVLFSGDLRVDCSDFPTEAMTEELDCFVCEFTHFRIGEHMDKFRKTNTKKLIFNHVSKYNIDALPALEAEFPYPVTVAVDRGCYEV